jgi:flagellar basal body-associated protein FliL
LKKIFTLQRTNYGHIEFAIPYKELSIPSGKEKMKIVVVPAVAAAAIGVVLVVVVISSSSGSSNDNNSSKSDKPGIWFL